MKSSYIDFNSKHKIFDYFKFRYIKVTIFMFVIAIMLMILSYSFNNTFVSNVLLSISSGFIAGSMIEFLKIIKDQSIKEIQAEIILFNNIRECLDNCYEDCSNLAIKCLEDKNDSSDLITDIAASSNFLNNLQMIIYYIDNAEIKGVPSSKVDKLKIAISSDYEHDKDVILSLIKLDCNNSITDIYNTDIWIIFDHLSHKLERYITMEIKSLQALLYMYGIIEL